MPTTWQVKRKNITFIKRPKSGKMRELSVPFVVAVRDMIGAASTAREVQFMVNERSVLVAGKPVLSQKLPVGLFEVVTFSKSKKSYRLVLNSHGGLHFVEADGQNTVARVVGKTDVKATKKSKTQINLLNGRNVLVDKHTVKVGDSVLLDKDMQIKEEYPLKKGASVILIAGKHIGSVGVVEDIQNKTITFKSGEEVFETRKAYAFVVGKSKPAIKLE